MAHHYDAPVKSLNVSSGNMQHGHPVGSPEILLPPERDVIEAAGRALLGSDVLMLNEVAKHLDLDAGRTLAVAAGLPQVFSDPYIHVVAADSAMSCKINEQAPEGSFEFGSAIALRNDAVVTSVSRHDIPVTGDWNPAHDVDLHMPRTALAVTAQLNFGSFIVPTSFVTTHLTPQRYENPVSVEENELQFIDLIEFAASMPGVVILGGDFNIRSDHCLPDGRFPFEVLRENGFFANPIGPTHRRHLDAEVDYQAIRISNDLSTSLAITDHFIQTMDLPISDHLFLQSAISFEQIVDITAAEFAGSSTENLSLVDGK